MRNLQEKLESTTRLVFTLSQQLNELKEQVKNRLNDYLSWSWERGAGKNTVICANRKIILCIPKKKTDPKRTWIPSIPCVLISVEPQKNALLDFARWDCIPTIEQQSSVEINYWISNVSRSSKIWLVSVSTMCPCSKILSSLFRWQNNASKNNGLVCWAPTPSPRCPTVLRVTTSRFDSTANGVSSQELTEQDRK